MADTRPPEALKVADVALIMVPLPAQGHLNQFLQFSRLLAIHGLSVHYVSTATHIRQARDRAGTLRRRDGYPVDHLIQFHHPPLPSFSSPPPDPLASTKFPSHLQPAFDATLQLKSAIEALVRSLASSYRRVVIVHDGPMSFVASSAAFVSNVESFCYHSISSIAGYLLRWEARGEPAEPAIAELNLPDVPKYVQVSSDEFEEFLRRQKQQHNVDAGRILNSCSAIEARFIDLVAIEPGWEEKKLFAIGPLNAIAMTEPEANDIGGVRHECLMWLDEQLPASVLYVSFGTTITLTDEQVAEIATGLETSTQRFIWVLKDADRADIYAPPADVGVARKYKLPLDYYKRIEGRGKVVGGWVPQQEILGHPSIGGFMSHCGWNSCLESFSNGVPLLAWPMHSDQPRNAQLVTHLLRVGFQVMGAVGGDIKGDVVPSAAIRDSVRRLMMEEEGKEVRARARELGMEVRRAVKDGGSSKADLDAFISHITR